MIKEKLNTHIYHLAQFFFINMTLKWHNINTFENFDKFSVIRHGFWLV